MPEINLLKKILPTLLVNGFHLDRVDRISPESTIVICHKYDKLGGQIIYALLITASVNLALVEMVISRSINYQATPIIISDTLYSKRCKCHTIEEFEKILGGFVTTGLVMISDLPDVLETLGHNKLPSYLTEGKASDLFEIYLKEALQFLVDQPVRRFGTDRLFESLPNGIILGKNFIAQYDAKAYSKGFSFSADDTERFAKYINQFNTTYGFRLTPIHTFLVISGSFCDSPTSILDRSDDLYERCKTKLCCLCAADLGRMVNIIKEFPAYRQAIDWKNLMSKGRPFITPDILASQLATIIKDNLL